MGLPLLLMCVSLTHALNCPSPSNSTGPSARAGAFVFSSPSGSSTFVYGGDADYSTLLGYESDLWQLDSAGNWTLLLASVRDAPSSAFSPGARRNGASWCSAHHWPLVFLGMGHGRGPSNLGYHNSMWSLDLITLSFTHLGGALEPDGQPVYGTEGVYHSDNTPSGRYRPAFCSSPGGRMLMFGGVGAGGADRGDLWEFSASLQQWRLLGGLRGADALGTVSSPGARDSAALWATRSSVYLGFGHGYDMGMSTERLSAEMWLFHERNRSFSAVLQGNAPPARFRQAYWSEEAGEALLLWGGSSSDGLWRFSDNSWSHLLCRGASGREDAASTHGGRLIIGGSSRGLLAEPLVLLGSQASAPAPSGGAPSQSGSTRSPTGTRRRTVEPPGTATPAPSSPGLLATLIAAAIVFLVVVVVALVMQKNLVSEAL